MSREEPDLRDGHCQLWTRNEGSITKMEEGHWTTEAISRGECLEWIPNSAMNKVWSPESRRRRTRSLSGHMICRRLRICTTISWILLQLRQFSRRKSIFLVLYLFRQSSGISIVLSRPRSWWNLCIISLANISQLPMSSFPSSHPAWPYRDQLRTQTLLSTVQDSHMISKSGPKQFRSTAAYRTPHNFACLWVSKLQEDL